MAVPAQRRLQTKEIRRFGSGREIFSIPDLTKIQTSSYEAFLQDEIPVEKRKDHGLESVLREIFPIESYDKTIKLEYVKYDLGKPRYTPEECRQLRLTYGRPFRIWLRLNLEQPIEEEVYLGDIPDHAGRRRVHHQRRRARGGEPVASQPRRRLRDGSGRHERSQAAELPHHSRTRQLDRDQLHEERHAQHPHRSKRQVLRDHAAAGDERQVRHRFRTAAGVLRNDDREDLRRPQRRQDRRQDRRRRHRLSLQQRSAPARSSSKPATRFPKRPPKSSAARASPRRK